MLCRTTLTYSAPGSSQPGGAAVEVDIRNAREADLPGWEACGFELVEHHSAVEDWTDDDEIAAVHYAEVEAVARELTGAPFAMVSDHVKRTANVERRPREQEPVHLVHSDFAAGYDEIVRESYHDVRGRGAATLARSGLTGDDVAAAADRDAQPLAQHRSAADGPAARGVRRPQRVAGRDPTVPLHRVRRRRSLVRRASASWHLARPAGTSGTATRT